MAPGVDRQLHLLAAGEFDPHQHRQRLGGRPSRRHDDRVSLSDGDGHRGGDTTTARCAAPENTVDATTDTAAFRDTLGRQTAACAAERQDAASNVEVKLSKSSTLVLLLLDSRGHKLASWTEKRQAASTSSSCSCPPRPATKVMKFST